VKNPRLSQADPQGWRAGNPDPLIAMAEAYTADATGAGEYMRFTVPTNLTENRRVQAVELLPGTRKVVHHAHAFIVPAPDPAKAYKPGRPPPGSPSKTFLFERAMAPLLTAASSADKRLATISACSHPWFRISARTIGLAVSARRYPRARISCSTRAIHIQQARSKKIVSRACTPSIASICTAPIRTAFLTTASPETFRMSCPPGLREDCPVVRLQDAALRVSFGGTSRTGSEFPVRL
jgi:hypothetical protein